MQRDNLEGWWWPRMKLVDRAVCGASKVEKEE